VLLADALEIWPPHVNPLWDPCEKPKLPEEKLQDGVNSILIHQARTVYKYTIITTKCYTQVSNPASLPLADSILGRGSSEDERAKAR